jgi:hypothetical protein
MPYALASGGPVAGPLHGMSDSADRRQACGEWGDMARARVTLPLVVSIAARDPRAFPPLTGHDSPDGPFQSPHVTEEQQA